MFKRNYSLLLIILALASLCIGHNQVAVAKDQLFSSDLPDNQWLDFKADGFDKPVSGIIFQKANPPACGVPLGGLGTGCLDIESRGVLGFESIFFPRRNMKPFIMYDVLRNPQLMLPFLGITVDGETWVLATGEFIDGGKKLGAIDPVVDGKYMQNEDYVESFSTLVPKISGVQAARDIQYWGHYPVADMQYQTGCPVQVNVRAWSPFILGDKAASSIPGAVFEVRLQNTSKKKKRVALAFSFPGPTNDEANAKLFTRTEIHRDLQGLHVVSLGNNIGYFLGLMDQGNVRIGDALHLDSASWSNIAKELPAAPTNTFNGKTLSSSAGSSVAVDVTLAPNESKTFRYILSWYVPEFIGGSYHEVTVAFERPAQWGTSPYPAPGRDNEMGEMYSPIYTTRYADAMAVAKRLKKDHVDLLQRSLAWQEIIYTQPDLPGWLKDCLINHLYTLAEDSLWVVPKEPLNDWAFPMGAFALTECPRICSITGCTASDWYGDFPIMYFFPDLQRMILRLYKAYQRPDGAIPFLWASRDVTKPTYDWQIGLNGPCLTGLVHRLWLVSGDDSLLTEFYPTIKKSVIFTMNLNPTPEGPISVHRKGPGQSWWEHTPIYGMVSHIGGVRLAYLRMAKNMAEYLGDKDFARQCQGWFDSGSKALEKNLWSKETKSYMLFNDPQTGKQSKTILSAQLDGDWACFINGLEPVFRRDRAAQVLKTVKETCLTDYGMMGMMDYDTEDGLPRPHEYGTFAPEIRMVGMTYMYNGMKDFGLEIIRRLMDNMVRKHGMSWDLYCLIMTDSGGRRTGADYYQNLMIWSIPAALSGTDLSGPCQPGGLVHRIHNAQK